MKDFVARLIAEKYQLQDSINRLEEFLDSDESETIDKFHLSLMEAQLESMRMYFHCLDGRISWVALGVNLQKGANNENKD